MSHSMGAVRFPDGLIMYFEYNGTSGVVAGPLRDTPEEVRARWRMGDSGGSCHGGTLDDPCVIEGVEFATLYGGGFSWEGEACRKCHAITEGGMPFNEHGDDGYDDETIYSATGCDGLPVWWPWEEDRD